MESPKNWWNSSRSSTWAPPAVSDTPPSNSQWNPVSCQLFSPLWPSTERWIIWLTNSRQAPGGIFVSSLEDIVYVDNIVLPYHTREQVQDNNPKREYVNKLSYLSSITSLHEVQKRTPEHDCVKPDTHLQSYNLYGGPPERLISEYTRAMSSTCSSTTRGIWQNTNRLANFLLKDDTTSVLAWDHVQHQTPSMNKTWERCHHPGDSSDMSSEWPMTCQRKQRWRGPQKGRGKGEDQNNMEELSAEESWQWEHIRTHARTQAHYYKVPFHGL